MLDKAKITAIQADLKKAMEEVARKHNLSLAPSRITYSATNFKVTAEFGDKNEIGDTNPIYVKDLMRNGLFYGLSSNMIGKPFRTAKGMLEFQGMRGKYAIGKASDGTMWKYDAAMVAGLLKA